MKNPEQRINIIIGQLEGVKKMINNKKNSCLDSVNQLKSVKSSVTSLMNKLLEEDLNNCFSNQRSSNKEKIKKIIFEILKN